MVTAEVTQLQQQATSPKYFSNLSDLIKYLNNNIFSEVQFTQNNFRIILKMHFFRTYSFTNVSGKNVQRIIGKYCLLYAADVVTPNRETVSMAETRQYIYCKCWAVIKMFNHNHLIFVFNCTVMCTI